MLVLHTSGYGKYLGSVNVVFDPSGEVRSFNGDPIVLDHSRKEDPELRGIVDRYRAEIDKKMNVAVGHSLEYVDGGRPGCRLYECAFGDLATDAMAAEMNVGMAILNSGAIKGSFNAGEYAIRNVEHDDMYKDWVPRPRFYDIPSASFLGSWGYIIKTRTQNPVIQLSHDCRGENGDISLVPFRPDYDGRCYPSHAVVK